MSLRSQLFSSCLMCHLDIFKDEWAWLKGRKHVIEVNTLTWPYVFRTWVFRRCHELRKYCNETNEDLIVIRQTIKCVQTTVQISCSKLDYCRIWGFNNECRDRAEAKYEDGNVSLINAKELVVEHEKEIGEENNGTQSLISKYKLLCWTTSRFR